MPHKEKQKKIMSEDREHKGAYVPKEEVALWFPVPQKFADMVEAMRQKYRDNGQRPPAPFQMIEMCIQEKYESGE